MKIDKLNLSGKKSSIEVLDKIFSAKINKQLVSNVIYKITCKKPRCQSFVYIGGTSRKFCQRLTDHRGYVHRKYLQTPVGHHFNQKGHCIQDLQAVAIEKVLPVNDHLRRKRRESMWINRYDSISFGANTKD